MWPFPDRPTSTLAQSTTTPQNSGTTVFLDELIRTRHSIRALSVSARKGVHSLLAGGERSPFKGRGIDFEEVRRYQAGDDVRHMDWRVTARSGHPHLKVFREERERPVFLVVDYTDSMLFGTKVAFKSVVAAQAASFIAWASHHRGDRVGAVVFSNLGHEESRPCGGNSGVLRALNVLTKQHQQAKQRQDKGTSNGQPAFLSALARVTHTARPGSLIFLFSDFRNMDARVMPWITRLGTHQDVVGILVYDQLEQEPPSPGIYGVTNGREFGEMNTRRGSFIQAYQEQFQARVQSVKDLFQQHNMGFFMVGTHESIQDSVHLGLNKVGARRKHLLTMTDSREFMNERANSST